MGDFASTCFSGPVLPATMMLILASLYWMLVVAGAFDFDFLDVDLEVDAEFDSALSVGFVALRFLNLGNVPLMLWGGVYSICFWVLAVVLDKPSHHEDLWLGVQVFFRNAAIAVVLTKIFTQPLRGRFDPEEPTSANELIDTECELTAETTATSGQARVVTDAAPFLLHVRSETGAIPKGDTVKIVGYDEERRVYLVVKPKDV